MLFVFMFYRCALIGTAVFCGYHVPDFGKVIFWAFIDDNYLIILT